MRECLPNIGDLTCPLTISFLQRNSLNIRIGRLMSKDTGSKHCELIKSAATEVLADVDIDQFTLSLLSKKAGVSKSIIRAHFMGEKEVLSGSCINCFAKMTAAVFQPNLLGRKSFEQGLQSIWVNYQVFAIRHERETNFIQKFLHAPSELGGEYIRFEVRKILRSFIEFLSRSKEYPVTDVQALMIIALLGNCTIIEKNPLTSNGSQVSQRVFNTCLLPSVKKIMALPIKQ
jgi:hypothetical protein